jgi:hypothetical protein
MLVSLQLVGVAIATFPTDPTNATVLVPCIAPKFVPEIVTEAPTVPKFGLTLVIIGPMTVKTTPLLATPPTVTTTLPVVAPAGTDTTMAVALQLVGVAGPPPLKVTVLVPWLAPKFVPVMVIEAPGTPELGVRLVMVGDVLVLVVAALNAATAVPQLADVPSDAAADAGPDAGCTWSSAISLVLGSAGTRSSIK